mmetsp:Transcript_15572/g.27299  ORF Transcript_15572/g.27299 Transcript_15572/m.27299 type:complete len:218 (+) Transcript_15572:350-1003(+)
MPLLWPLLPALLLPIMSMLRVILLQPSRILAMLVAMLLLTTLLARPLLAHGRSQIQKQQASATVGQAVKCQSWVEPVEVQLKFSWIVHRPYQSQRHKTSLQISKLMRVMQASLTLAGWRIILCPSSQSLQSSLRGSHTMWSTSGIQKQRRCLMMTNFQNLTHLMKTTRKLATSRPMMRRSSKHPEKKQRKRPMTRKPHRLRPRSRPRLRSRNHDGKY